MSKRMKMTVAAALTVFIIVVILLSVYAGTRQTALDRVDLQYFYVADEYLSVVDRTDSYLGHPDLVKTSASSDSEALLVAYPAGHGKGEIIMKESSDGGNTWSERRTDLPESFADSQETPTLYRLDFTDGTSKILLVSGCPSWSADDEYEADGFNYSLSSDEGKTWTEFSNAYGIEWAESMPDKGDPAYDGIPEEELPNFDENGKVLPYDVIVAMSSLTQLKDDGGNYIDAWMGTFHDYGFYNYTSILTFDDNGEPNWSEPRKFLHDRRDTESAANLCELEIYRAPDDTLILLGRSNSRTMNSMISVSTDEGATWSELKELPYCLTGDRHKAEYDAATGNLIVSFRLYLPGLKPNALSVQKNLGGYWVAWVGTPEALIEYAENSAFDKTSRLGSGMLVIAETNDGASDCGYSGTVCLDDGTFVLTSYGKFSSDADEPYILQAKFRLSDVIPT